VCVSQGTASQPRHQFNCIPTQPNTHMHDICAGGPA
jgi:hypothetical protein